MIDFYAFIEKIGFVTPNFYFCEIQILRLETCYN